MRKMKLTLSALVIFAIVGSALAFKSMPLGGGSVWCIDNGTTCSDLRNFRAQAGGNVADVCGGPEYLQTTGDCIEQVGPFVATPAGK